MFIDIVVKAIGIQLIYAVVVLGVDWLAHRKTKGEDKGGIVK